MESLTRPQGSRSRASTRPPPSAQTSDQPAALHLEIICSRFRTTYSTEVARSLSSCLFEKSGVWSANAHPAHSGVAKEGRYTLRKESLFYAADPVTATWALVNRCATSNSMQSRLVRASCAYSVSSTSSASNIPCHSLRTRLYQGSSLSGGSGSRLRNRLAVNDFPFAGIWATRSSRICSFGIPSLCSSVYSSWYPRLSFRCFADVGQNSPQYQIPSPGICPPQHSTVA